MMRERISKESRISVAIHELDVNLVNIQESLSKP
jgi:hypothetical protein